MDTRSRFEESKRRLTESTLLAHPLQHTKLILKTDDKLRLKHFFLCLPRWLLKTTRLLFFQNIDRNTAKIQYVYRANELTIYASLKFFRHLMKARDITITTDYKPLLYTLVQPSDKASERQRRQLDFINQITIKIILVSREENEIADTLSQLEAINMSILISTDELYTEQQTDAELKSLLES